MPGHCARPNRRKIMHWVTSLPLQSFRARLGLLICGLALLAGLPARAAEQWTAITGALLERLTNSGAKPAWPGGCSGVVVNRTNGDVTIKVVGLGLWRSTDQGKNWLRIDDRTISGRDET